MTIELTEQEAQALRFLIDCALKHSGIQVAEAAVYSTKKLAEAATNQREPPND
jgi:hypothetical protein